MRNYGYQFLNYVRNYGYNLKKYAELWVPFWKNIATSSRGTLRSNKINVQLEIYRSNKMKVQLEIQTNFDGTCRSKRKMTRIGYKNNFDLMPVRH